MLRADRRKRPSSFYGATPRSLADITSSALAEDLAETVEDLGDDAANVTVGQLLAEGAAIVQTRRS